MKISFDNWKSATGNLQWGVQHTLYTTLELVAEGKINLVHNRDYDEGSPCLINAVGQMLQAGGGNGIPTANFEELVYQFDFLNRKFIKAGINDKNSHKVSKEAAQLLLDNAAERLEAPKLPNPEKVEVDIEVSERELDKFLQSL